MRYSPNFSKREMACRCGCRTLLHIDRSLAKLCAALESLRALAGCPIVIHSAYRCVSHNQAVGGAPGSQHLSGIAADISTRKHTPAELGALAEKIPAFAGGGIGVYPSWIHVDIREGRARW